jgi:lipid-A-disaccharide synthase
MVTAYRVGEVEAFILRRIVNVQSVILANLVIGENVIPEFLQEACTADNLVPALADLLAETPARTRQVEAFDRLDSIMSTGAASPSVRAADVVLATMRQGRRVS